MDMEVTDDQTLRTVKILSTLAQSRNRPALFERNRENFKTQTLYFLCSDLLSLVLTSAISSKVIVNPAGLIRK